MTTKDIAEMIGLKEVTVRKYALALEAAGYLIERDEQSNRVYSDMDAMVFNQMKVLRDRSGLSVEKCAEAVAVKHKQASVSVSPVVVEQKIERYDTRYEEQINEFKSIMVNMAKENERIREELAELSKAHESQLLRSIEQNAKMTEILREVLETKQMIAADRERKWWKFWG